jgi:hypothetical protein
MSYTAGGTIQANDYNNLAWGGNTSDVYNSSITNTAQVWGTGFGHRGYGQTTSQIAAVAAAGFVTATQWAGLIYTVNAALGHQAGVGGQLASGSNIGVIAGATIAAFANVATAVGTINTNSNTAATTGATITGASFAQGITGGATSFTNIFTRQIRFWGGPNAARYFFNAGGQIKWVITSTTNNNGTLTSADLVTQWSTYQVGGTLFTSSATPRTGAGGTVNTANTSLGFWQAGTVTTTISQITSANYRYEYNQDFTNVRVRTDGVAGSNGANGGNLFLDFGTSKTSTFAGTNDDVNVTVNHRIDIVLPESTFLANTWGIIGVS